MKKLLLVALIGLGVFLYVYRVDVLRSVQRVDASSPETMRTSIAEINEGLSDEEKLIFAKGMMKLTSEGINLDTLIALGGSDEARWTMLSKQVNGKSVRVILAKGRE